MRANRPLCPIIRGIEQAKRLRKPSNYEAKNAFNLRRNREAHPLRALRDEGASENCKDRAGCTTSDTGQCLATGFRGRRQRHPCASKIWKEAGGGQHNEHRTRCTELQQSGYRRAIDGRKLIRLSGVLHPTLSQVEGGETVGHVVIGAIDRVEELTDVAGVLQGAAAQFQRYAQFTHLLWPAPGSPQPRPPGTADQRFTSDLSPAWSLI